MKKSKDKKENRDKSEIIIYKNSGGEPRISVHLENETVWLSQKQIAELFGVQRPAITKHLNNIFESGELDEKVVCSILELPTQHGAIKDKTQNVKTKFYNLDAILSVGYRVNSKQATQFRIWASKILKEYMIKGFTMDDERLKGTGGGNYWKELLDRIRDIRSSEKVLYRQVLDLYATSVDYNSTSEKTILFFKTVQNKLHYAAHGKTAAEVIMERANADKPFMGLLSFSGKDVSKKDIGIAKNYLSKKELKVLNNIVSAYFDMAEVKAMNHEPMKMKDWMVQFDKMIEIFDKKLLTNAGKMSHKKALEKAEKEYKKYQVKTLSPVEKDYLEVIKNVEKKVDKNKK
jgi:hypothetical protein